MPGVYYSRTVKKDRVSREAIPTPGEQAVLAALDAAMAGEAVGAAVGQGVSGAAADGAAAGEPGAAGAEAVQAGELTGLGVTELAEATGRHPNSVRADLAELMDAGLVERYAAGDGSRGRPRWLHRRTQRPEPTREGAVHAALATALARRLAAASADPRGEGIAAGEDWGRGLARQDAATGDAHARVEVVLSEAGFAPQGAHGRYRLTRCPLLSEAEAIPEVVCSVHLGLVRGVLSAAGEDPEGTELTPFSVPGGCLLTLPGADA